MPKTRSTDRHRQVLTDSLPSLFLILSLPFIPTPYNGQEVWGSAIASSAVPGGARPPKHFGAIHGPKFAIQHSVARVTACSRCLLCLLQRTTARADMTLTSILLLAITSTSIANAVTSRPPCQRLLMQGLDNTQLLPHAELSGLYSLTNITFSGFPAYRHENHPNEYFFYNSTRRALVLGGGLLLAHTSGRLPMNNVRYPYSRVIIGWRVYQPATNRLLFRFCRSLQ